MAMGVTLLDEINLVLQDIGASPEVLSPQAYANDVAALETQVAGESGWYGSDRAYNPANTSLHEQGADNQNFPDYQTVQQGAKAWADTLLHTSGNPYHNAVFDLQAGKDPTAFLRDIAASPWDAGHYQDSKTGGNKLLEIYSQHKDVNLKSIGLQPAAGKTSYGTAAANGTLDQGRVYDEGPIPGSKEAAKAVGKAASGVVGWSEGLGKLLGHVTSSSFWKRLGLGAAGVLMLLIGIAVLNEKSIGSVVKSTKVMPIPV